MSDDSTRGFDDRRGTHDAGLTPLPTQPSHLPWPSDAWPTGQPSDRLRATRFESLIDAAFHSPSTPDYGESHALVIIQGGRLVFERYNQGFGPDDTYRSWSMAKSITHALTGLLVGDGKIDIFAPADVPEWQRDARAAITLDHLLRMSSGLDWVEDETPGRPFDNQIMLFGEGQSDMAAYAARTPLAHPPGSFFHYATANTLLICRCLSRAIGLKGREFRDFMRARLFEPIGAKTPKPRWDGAGTFIGGSFCRASARDFARFGLLYLRDGIWAGKRLLPEGWVDYARTPTYQQPGSDGEGHYGAHWWLGFGGAGSFSAMGAEGQYTVCVPSLDLVLVRLGVTPHAQRFAMHAWVAEVIDCFRS